MESKFKVGDRVIINLPGTEIHNHKGTVTDDIEPVSTKLNEFETCVYLDIVRSDDGDGKDRRVLSTSCFLFLTPLHELL